MRAGSLAVAFADAAEFWAEPTAEGEAQREPGQHRHRVERDKDDEGDTADNEQRLRDASAPGHDGTAESLGQRQEMSSSILVRSASMRFRLSSVAA